MEHAGYLKVMRSPKTARETSERQRDQHVPLLLTETIELTFKLLLFATTEELGAKTVDYNVCVGNKQQVVHLYRLFLKYIHSCNRFRLLTHQINRHSYSGNEMLLPCRYKLVH
jgi:hypothetical protein